MSSTIVNVSNYQNNLKFDEPKYNIIHMKSKLVREHNEWWFHSDALKYHQLLLLLRSASICFSIFIPSGFWHLKLKVLATHDAMNEPPGCTRINWNLNSHAFLHIKLEPHDGDRKWFKKKKRSKLHLQRQCIWACDTWGGPSTGLIIIHQSCIHGNRLSHKLLFQPGWRIPPQSTSPKQERLCPSALPGLYLCLGGGVKLQMSSTVWCRPVLSGQAWETSTVVGRRGFSAPTAPCGHCSEAERKPLQSVVKAQQKIVLAYPPPTSTSTQTNAGGPAA